MTIFHPATTRANFKKTKTKSIFTLVTHEQSCERLLVFHIFSEENECEWKTIKIAN